MNEGECGDHDALARPTGHHGRAARDRYEAHLDGELAGVLEYKVKRGRIALIHTEVLPVHEGRGVGSALVRFALDDARRRELRVIATCPYVKDYLTRHPEAADAQRPFEYSVAVSLSHSDPALLFWM